MWRGRRRRRGEETGGEGARRCGVGNEEYWKMPRLKGSEREEVEGRDGELNQDISL